MVQLFVPLTQLDSDWCQYHEWGRGVPNSPIIKKLGMEGNNQTWAISEEAEFVSLPQVSTLMVAWADGNYNDANVYRFLEKREAGEASEDLFLIKTAYMIANFLEETRPSYSEDIDLFLHVQSECVREVMSKISKGSRFLIKQSLIQNKLMEKVGGNGDGKLRLTSSGKSFVNDVVVPYTAIIVDRNTFAVSEIFEVHRKLLLEEPDTFYEDRSELKLLLERFGSQLANRYKKK